MAGIDINRTTEGVVLPTAVSNEIWSKTIAESFVLANAPRIDLPGGGTEIQVVTGDPEPEWTNETDSKPVGEHTLSSKAMRGYTLALIEPFSNQFRRDKGALYNVLIDRLPRLLGQKYDRTVFGQYAAPGSDFDTLADAPSVDVSEGYAGYLAALKSVADNGGDVTKWAISPSGEISLLGQLDSTGRPIFTPSVQQGSIGTVLGRSVEKTLAAADLTAEPPKIGIAGDWSRTRSGIVENISISVSDQATITKGGQDINLWQRNMFAVRVEFEVGFIAEDVNQFAFLTDGTEDAEGND